MTCSKCASEFIGECRVCAQIERGSAIIKLPPVAVRRTSEASKNVALVGFGEHLRKTKEKQLLAIEAAVPALERLVKVCAQKTGQSYKVRNLLYSLWNGQASSLLEIVTVDWAIKEDLLAVLLAFGSEPRDSEPFFYDAIAGAFKSCGLFNWFTEAQQSQDQPG